MKESKLIFELKRKTVHLLAFVYILLYILLFKNFNQRIAILSLLFILLFFIAIELFRLNWKKKIPLVHLFLRVKEENSIGGHIYFLLGVVISFAVFDIRIAFAALSMMLFGDAAATVFGIWLGTHWIKKLPETAWEGIIAEFLVDLAIGWILFANLWIVIPMALTATIVETLIPHVDDNLAIPLFSGLIGQAIRMLL